MNYHDIYECDMNNGKGARVTLFLSGCIHGCKGCYNVETWNPNSGKPFTKETEDHIISLLKDKEMVRAGLSLSGGDPLHEANVKGVTDLILRVRKECPDKNIWLWTGFTLKELTDAAASVNHTLVDVQRFGIANNVDVLIDGKFVQEEHDPTLKWRGSANQVIHNFSSVEI